MSENESERKVNPPEFFDHLTEWARLYNSPLHFVRDIENFGLEEDLEIVPSKPPKYREVKVHKKKIPHAPR